MLPASSVCEESSKQKEGRFVSEKLCGATAFLCSMLALCSEVCSASVVFGLGKELYQTEEIKSCEPEWNQEATM